MLRKNELVSEIKVVLGYYFGPNYSSDYLLAVSEKVIKRIEELTK